MTNDRLSHAVLRAIDSLAARTPQRARAVPVRLLCAVVPAPYDLLATTVDALDERGFLIRDDEGLRLTLRGFAAAKLPTMIAHERRTREETPVRYRREGDLLRLRKAIRVA